MPEIESGVNVKNESGVNVILPESESGVNVKIESNVNVKNESGVNVILPESAPPCHCLGVRGKSLIFFAENDPCIHSLPRQMSTPVQKLMGFHHLKRALKLLHKEKYLHLLDFRNLNSIQLDCKVKRKMKIPQYTLMNSNLTLLRNSNKAFLKEKWNGNMCPFKSNLVENFENILE